MPIETLGAMNSRLGTNSVEGWMKSVDFDKSKVSPELGLEGDFNRTIGEESVSGKSFFDLLSSKVGEVNQLQQEANLAIEKLATGRTKNIHETMLAVEQAEIAFKTMNQIRRKVIEAYKEIMNMQV